MGKFEKLAIILLILSATIVMALFSDDPTETVESDPVTVALERMALDNKDDSSEASAPAGVPTEGSPVSAASVMGDTGILRGSAPVGPAPTEASAPVEDPAPRTTELLLDASTRPPSSEEPLAELKPRILQNLRGLRPSSSADYMEYRVQDGDTWAGLAQRFYRNGRYTRNLRLANEDLEDLRVRRPILVPVFDHLVESGKRAPLRPVVIPASAPRSGAKTTQPRPIGRSKETKRSPLTRPEIYEVEEGDNLSKVSLMFYGTASRWQEIYEANRGLLESADWLELGMKLTIPVVDLSTPIKRAPEGATKRPTQRAEKSSGKKKPKVD